MESEIDEVFLKPGDRVTFGDRDDLLETLDRLGQRIPGRRNGRTLDHREHDCMIRYLRFRAHSDSDFLPTALRKPPAGQDPPDFVLEWDGREESFELTDGSTREYQRFLDSYDRCPAPNNVMDEAMVYPEGLKNSSKDEAVQRWSEIMFSAFRRKSEMLRHGRFGIDHLLIYDMTGLGLLVPLEAGAARLREEIDGWHRNHSTIHRFEKVSLLRDGALLFNLTGTSEIVNAESPYFQLFVIRSSDEEDLKRRLRELDRYCRDHSIQYLKLFGSILGDRVTDFQFEASDLDLLVQFQPGTSVTLFDQARMEREIGEILGFEVDLRTAEDLSRYFRQRVLDQAVELHARRA